METLIRDLRYAVRTMLRRPGISLVIVAALAIGIGANTAIFSVVNSILLRPLAYGEPERLVMVWMNNTRMKVEEDIHSYPNYIDYRDQNRTFEHLATYYGISVNLIGSGEPERIIGTATSANMRDVLKVDPILGRFYSSEEEQPGKDTVVVLSHALWQRRFAGDPEIVGQTLNLSDTIRTVIGVMPPGFKFPHKDAEFWVPMAVDPQRATARGSFGYWVIGRLSPGVTIEQARADMSTIAQNLEQQYFNILEGYGVNLVPLHQQVVGTVKPVLLVLLAAVACVLLIACANVANLLLARAATREREIAVRTALGAGRGRLIRQLLTESLVLAVTGGVLGLLLAYLGLRGLIAISPEDVPRLDEIKMDWQVLVFTLAVSVVTGLLFGMAPALQSSKADLNEALKEGGRGSTGVRGKRLRGVLVVAEIALSLVLLIGAGLLIKSFVRMQRVDMGFNPDKMMMMNVQLTRSRYQGKQGAEFYRRLIERLEGMPGIESAGATTAVFISNLPNSSNFSIEGRPPMPAAEQVEVPIDFVTPGYFRAMGIPLLRGRELTEQDDTTTPRVVLINKTFADRFWPDEDPLGKRITYGGGGPNASWMTIVGVVGDMRRTGYDAAVRCETFLPYTQRNFIGFMTMVVRTTSEPASMIGTVRDVVREIDPNQPVSHVRTMDEQLGNMTAQRRLNMVLLGGLGVVALVLASVGIYGVMSYSVSQRTHEIGVRVALGATSGKVFGLVLRQGVGLAVIGVVLGLAGSFVLTTFLPTGISSSLLYQVSGTDRLIFALVPIVMSTVAVAACLIPARRATAVDPITALRYE